MEFHQGTVWQGEEALHNEGGEGGRLLVLTHYVWEGYEGLRRVGG